LTGEVESVEMYGNMNKYSDDLGVIEFWSFTSSPPFSWSRRVTVELDFAGHW
jgi:hypothetical protein